MDNRFYCTGTRFCCTCTKCVAQAPDSVAQARFVSQARYSAAQAPNSVAQAPCSAAQGQHTPLGGRSMVSTISLRRPNGQIWAPKVVLLGCLNCCIGCQKLCLCCREKGRFEAAESGFRDKQANIYGSGLLLPASFIHPAPWHSAADLMG